MNKAREIADKLFPDNNGWCGDRLAIPIQTENGIDFDFIPFNPYENWNDCGMVLEALARSAHVVCIGSGKLIIITSPLTKQEIYPFTLGGICEAFLSMEVL